MTNNYFFLLCSGCAKWGGLRSREEESEGRVWEGDAGYQGQVQDRTAEQGQNARRGTTCIHTLNH